MTKYAYPAVFTPEGEGYCVNFPDVESCYTCGDNLEHALFMAEDVLALTLYNSYEEEHKPTPKPSAINDIELSDGEFVNFVRCDTAEYQDLFAKDLVRKTVTIPKKLNDVAEGKNIDFSKTLQNGLIA